MNIFKTLSVVVLVFLERGLSDEFLDNDRFYCHTTDKSRDHVKTFGATTPYDEVRGEIFKAEDFSKCKPARFWLVSRHGSRYPSEGENLLSRSDDINKQIVKNYPSNTTLCLTDVQELDKWEMNPNFTNPSSGYLTETGWKELKGMGQRFQKAFPELLPTNYSKSHYFFRSTFIPRTLQSAKAFASGLFDTDNYNSVDYVVGSKLDLFLLPFARCQTWVDVAFVSIPEQQKFLLTDEYRQMVQQVSEKLGFHGSEQLSADKIDKLVTHCKYEQMYNHLKPSAFCSAFSIANHRVSEYYYDLFHYYRSGYGFKEYRGLFENMSCTMVQAMLKFLQSNDPNDQIAKIWFGHDASLQLIFVSLGLYEDSVPLRANNFAQQSFRKWKTSLLSPMAGNLAIIRFDCDDGDNEVLFLHNEIPMQIPGCLPNGVCKLSLILQKYRRFLTADCAEVMCSNTRL